MIRSLIAVLTIAFAAAAANGQLDSAITPTAAAGLPQSKLEYFSKPELLRRIALYESAAQNADAAHASNESLVKIYTNLGALYEDVAMYLKAEDAMRRAIVLLKDGPQDQLAEEIGHLTVLHIAMDELREAEKDQMRALKIRETVGDPVGMALTWNDLADLYVKQRQFKKAVDYGQRAMDVLGARPDVSADDRIAVRQTLAFALSGARDYPRAIQLLKDAVELSKSSFGADSLQVRIDDYLLGYAYWKSGDKPDAAECMRRGITRMKVDLGWGQVIYVNAIRQYAQFLHDSGQAEEAALAKREVRQAEVVVDARAFTGRPAEFRTVVP
jgi:tetratricopeptide (TPR) repeat protein